MSLTGKVAIVTGAAQGLGKAFCSILLDNGAKSKTFHTAKEMFGNIDIVCNNAGVGLEKAGWEKTVDINLKGVIRGTNLAMDYLRKDKGGRGGVVVNVSSMAGLNPNPFGPVYCATKHAIVGFTRSWVLNPETSQNGIRMNMLCPAFVDTNLVSSISDDTCLNVDKAKQFVQQIGVMTPEFVAEGFLELVTDENKNGALLKMGKSFGKAYHTFERA
ncbi:hypothetical protein LOTGIDRAFT_235335 [Lottia gigantea]|uniref:15-hydroxyprostaglandin dehydrogenase n=1 Tax=Lottia gigantea TaxID=225164 RepID=V3Z6T9_LOTGI|nr:hypothetical protein LOTGIDRAFT_235335 [Lottia gigantea]ESO86523.1 hypothetical protein LOTGIDRAFT_235335 [Lottia gigantea]